LVDGLWLVEGGQVSAGSVLTWLSEQIYRLDDKGLHELLQEAAAFPVNGTGLLTRDYFMGNRTPYRDPTLRGAMIGLSLGQGRAALYRSAVESVAVAAANVVDAALNAGVSFHRVVASGGICHNPLWLQATVDAIGMPMILPAEENLTILGTVASAATAAGLLPDLFTAAAVIARPGRSIEPDPTAHARYIEILSRYREVTTILRDTMHDLARKQISQ
jgi:ribulose kinase